MFVAKFRKNECVCVWWLQKGLKGKRNDERAIDKELDGKNSFVSAAYGDFLPTQ